MRANNITEVLDGFQSEVKMISERTASNGFGTEETDAEFEKFDGKINSIKTAVLKTQEMDGGDYNYVAPRGIQTDKNVTADSLRSELIFMKERFTKFRDNLKKEKYKVVNPRENTIKHLNNTTKGLFTKSIKDLEELAGLI